MASKKISEKKKCLTMLLKQGAEVQAGAEIHRLLLFFNFY